MKNLALKLAAAAIFLALSTPHASALNCTLYVDGLNGVDTNDGQTSNTAFKTTSAAVSAAKAGDTICVAPTATYGKLSVWKSGTADKPITIVGSGSTPTLVRTNSDAFAVYIYNGASYIVLQNFDISAGAGGYGYSGVFIGRTTHHITVTGNTVHECGGSGIQTVGADWITISRNVVWGNGLNTSHAYNSGISTYENGAVDTYTGVKMVIDSNLIYNNTNTPRTTGNNAYKDSDGSGIIVDDTTHSQSDNVPYTGTTLVQNNIIFNNGGRGIHIYESEHVIAVNNTVYKNNKDLYEAVSQSPGEININSDGNHGGGDMHIYNNILYSDGLNTTNPSTGQTSGTHVCLSIYQSNDGQAGPIIVNNNLCYNPQGNPNYMYSIVASSTQQLFADNIFRGPKLAAPSSIDFTLLAGSPAIGAGFVNTSVTPASTIVPAYDYAGVTRPNCGPTTIGAYQYNTINGVCAAVPPSTRAPTSGLCTAGNPGPVAGSGPWTWICNGLNGGSASGTCTAQVLGDTVTVNKPSPLVCGRAVTITGNETDPAQAIWLDWRTWGVPAIGDDDWVQATVDSSGNFSANMVIDHSDQVSTMYYRIGDGPTLVAWRGRPR